MLPNKRCAALRRRARNSTPGCVVVVIRAMVVAIHRTRGQRGLQRIRVLREVAEAVRLVVHAATQVAVRSASRRRDGTNVVPQARRVHRNLMVIDAEAIALRVAVREQDAPATDGPARSRCPAPRWPA